MTSENASEQAEMDENNSSNEVSVPQSPDGIIEIETYDVAPVSGGDVVEEIASQATEIDNLSTMEANSSDYISDTVQSVDEVSNPEPAADIPARPVSNMTNEASAMATPTTPPTPPSGDKFEDWIRMPESSWPPPIFMKRTISPKERYYLEYRWHSQWSFYDSKATQNKNTYYYLQRFVVIGSLIIPALISLNSTIARFINEFIPGGTDGTENIVRIGVDAITVIISLAVAGSAALESLYKYGENWSSYRSAAEELQAEKNFYDMGAGPYAVSTNPFATFVERIEGIIANQNGKYFQAVQAQIAKQTADNEEIVDTFLASDDDDDVETPSVAG